MDHLEPFQPRKVLSLADIKVQGWHIKRYAIMAEGRVFDDTIAEAAGVAAIARLPPAGSLMDAQGNHGIALQIVHFAQTGVVSPVFYWRWGSVVAEIDQMRASWDAPTIFNDGAKHVIGCIWEMDIVSFEIAAWKATVLGVSGTPQDRLAAYMTRRFA